MTVVPDRQPVVVANVDEALEVVRQGGLRLTAPRRLVLQALFAADRPVSAEDIADGLGERTTKVDMASVYRVLEALGELGLVRHFHVGHGPGRYALVGDGTQEYVACQACGALESLPSAALEGVRQEVRERSGFEVDFSHFPMVGLCARCAKRRVPTASDARSPTRDGGQPHR